MYDALTSPKKRETLLGTEIKPPKPLKLLDDGSFGDLDFRKYGPKFMEVVRETGSYEKAMNEACVTRQMIAAWAGNIELRRHISRAANDAGNTKTLATFQKELNRQFLKELEHKKALGRTDGESPVNHR